MRAVIIRHAEVNYSWSRRCTSEMFDSECEKYDLSPIKNVIYSIPQIVYQKIYISELSRSKDTAKILFPMGEYLESQIINEVPLKSSFDTDERREDVMKYMALYVDYIYQAGELYANEDFTGFIGLEDSENAHKLPQVRMLFRMLTNIRFSKLKSLVRFAKQIGSSNAKYAKKRHLDTLMVCVDKGHRNTVTADKGVTRYSLCYKK